MYEKYGHLLYIFCGFIGNVCGFIGNEIVYHFYCVDVLHSAFVRLWDDGSRPSSDTRSRSAVWWRAGRWTGCSVDVLSRASYGVLHTSSRHVLVNGCLQWAACWASKQRHQADPLLWPMSCQDVIGICVHNVRGMNAVTNLRVFGILCNLYFVVSLPSLGNVGCIVFSCVL